jgi:hypothetical protein
LTEQLLPGLRLMDVPGARESVPTGLSLRGNLNSLEITDDHAWLPVTCAGGIMKNIAVPIARIAARTATIPIRSSAAASATTANILSWEWRQFACSPLSAEGRRVRRYFREVTETREDTAGVGSRNRRSKQQAAARANGAPHAQPDRRADPG